MRKQTNVGKEFADTVTACVSRKIFKEIGGQLAASLAAYVDLGKAGHVDIVNCPMPDPTEYSSADTFARDYQAYSLLRKYPDFNIGIDREEVAIAAFHDSEASCRTLNRCNGFIPYTFDSDQVPLDQTLEAVIHTARGKIQKLLGPFDWNEVAQGWRFSGGASTRLKRRTGDLYYKLQGRPHVTRDCALLAVCAIWHNEGWQHQARREHGDDPCNWVTIVPGSKYTTVPKNAKTDRGICIEPEMNMFFQLGIGSIIRKRLKRVNIDLNDQSVNQRLALIGSRTGALSTIDLKSASDSISLETVRLLFPSDWMDAFERVRCKTTEIRGETVTLEKISSMGNGYTFELESLLFWAISSSVLDVLGCEDTRLGVYGDDIVIHNSAAAKLISILSNLGFETNIDKTFVSGPFRESCGKHYFYGCDVSPFSITKPVIGSNRIFLHWNQCRDWWVPLTSTMAFLNDQLPVRARRLVVPWYESPESGFRLPFDQATPNWCRTTQQWKYRKLVPRTKNHAPSGVYSVLAWCFRSDHSDEVMEPYLIEKGDVKYYVASATTSQWDALV